jgi:hypothetical protein
MADATVACEGGLAVLSAAGRFARLGPCELAPAPGSPVRVPARHYPAHFGAARSSWADPRYALNEGCPRRPRRSIVCSEDAAHGTRKQEADNEQGRASGNATGNK